MLRYGSRSSDIGPTQDVMPEVRPQHVIAIYGVGNPAPGEVERSLRATLDAAAPGAAITIHEFDWNQFAEHARRSSRGTAQYGAWFAGSFAAAAWCRPLQPSTLERVRSIVDVAVHGLWAATQSLTTLLLAVALLGFLTSEVSSLLAGWVHPFTLVGMLPAGVGWRAAAIAGRSLDLAAFVVRNGAMATALSIALSLAIAVVEALGLRSLRPLAVTIRRHVFVLLLAPCTLLSLVMSQRSTRGPLVSWSWLAGYVGLGAFGVLVMGIVSIFTGGSASTIAWAFLVPAVFVAAAFAANVVDYLRGGAGRVWLVWAKVLLDIGLYVGSPPYRDTILRELARLVAAIPDRSMATIWIAGHSLGSVIALDSLSHSDVWQPYDRVRLVTLGSPIRRFFRRFFPNLFFDADVDRAAHRVATRVADFVWVNAFRRFDYVGKALRFRPGGGQDLPTRQWWPAHVNYWGDLDVARSVLHGLDTAPSIRGSAGDTVTELPGHTLDIPAPLQRPLIMGTMGGAVVLAVASLAVAGWLVFPGFGPMLLPHDVALQNPASTTALVRHERGLTGEPGRFHQFTFDFNDADGRPHRVLSWVPGTLGLWSDPRFDYIALARFVRADCVPERLSRAYEIGWSVPCTRSDVPIVYDRAAPARFHVTGFEYSPGWLARAGRFFFGLLLVAMTTLLVVMAGALLIMSWIFLVGLFSGHPDVRDVILSREWWRGSGLFGRWGGVRTPA
jgi:hypothetical protein